MKKLSILFVLLLSMAVVTVIAQQQTPDKFTYQQAQGHQQAGPADAWETCPEGSIYSHEPSIPDGYWSFYTSDASFPYIVCENFSGITAPIRTIHFWGLNLFYYGFWNQCSWENPMTFEIKFYEDAAGSPGTFFYSETLTLSRDATGLYYSEFAGYHYSAILTNPVSLASGWISIQGVSTGSPDNCAFLWGNSPTGDLISFQGASMSSLQPLGDNLSICIEADAAAVPVASWALILGAVLIAVTVFLRYRRIS